MATSTIPALKKNLTAQLAANAGLTGVQVSYGAPIPNPGREYIWLGDVEGDDVPAALGRNRHAETYNLEVIIQSMHEGRDQEAATERAFTFRDLIDTQLRSDITVGGALGSGWAFVSGHFKLEELASDTQRGALLTIQVACEARI
jgi:hypothetical protein